MSASFLIILYIIFRAKHFVCDFLLQTDWMALTKGKPGKEGYQALFIHTSIHALFTFGIVMIFAPSLWWLGPLDFVTHSLIDRFKGVFTFNKGWQPKDTIFWWTFGLDQEAHNITHMVYIVLIAINMGIVCFYFS
ncbi:MAG: DUF3307 domain-containing protein [Pseudomonadota bacterium]